MKTIFITLFFLVMLTGSVSTAVAQITYKRAGSDRDSVELAKLPDSIKNYPEQLFPDAAEYKWSACCFANENEGDSTRAELKRPSLERNTSDTLSRSANVRKNRGRLINYVCNIKDASGNLIGEVAYTREDGTDVYEWVNTKYHINWLEDIPADVLKKIEKELDEQAGEEIKSILLIEHSSAWITYDIYEKEGDFYKFKDTKPLADGKYYWVWGTINGTHTNGSYQFKMNGEYIPCYEHDAWYNKKMKFQE